ncbi:MAG TPA: hypothetical protein VLH56_13700 [Dissulfurispiraceae bacterium]|nr:hypothetical protein [Dissulfurispiraceae bacterium]
MPNTTLIFSHYGYSTYLEYSLACARKTNPHARLVFLGDEHNHNVAVRAGWEHFLFNDFRSHHQSRFGDVFRHVQGKNHNPIKNGKDWLRYVFERWFFIDGFVSAQSIDRFWHFDSDTMVMQNLNCFEQQLGVFDFTVQCNNTCLNGLVKRVVVSEYCEWICKLFENDDFLTTQQKEFDTAHPDWAFTEMRAFDSYQSDTTRPRLHLLHYADDQVFDDCICQEHGFQMCALPSGEIVKQLISMDGKVYGYRDSRVVEFVTLNLSWVPDYVFSWVMTCLDGGGRAGIEQAQCSFHQTMRGLVRKMRRLVKNATS